MGRWLLRLSAKILALLRLSVNSFQLRLTKKLKITLFCFKELNINKPVFFVSLRKIEPRSQGSLLPALWSEREREPGKRWSRGFRTKLFLREESFVSHFFCHVYSQQQDRFANPSTTITETKGNFCLNKTIR